MDDQEEDYIVLTCPVCGCEFQPPEAGETYEAESSFEEQFENSQFAQDEYPNGYEDDGNDFFGDE